ncbi:uncharacterized protein [Miscanthus floridulus]|uniref:uncharacterized protein isoform X2 n=1 Tax=Miscanthus floridulus TaxID=154761 RepID=UPI003459BDA6
MRGPTNELSTNTNSSTPTYQLKSSISKHLPFQRIVRQRLILSPVDSPRPELTAAAETRRNHRATTSFGTQQVGFAAKADYHKLGDVSIQHLYALGQCDDTKQPRFKDSKLKNLDVFCATTI